MTCPKRTIEEPFELVPGDNLRNAGIDFTNKLDTDTISSVTITKSIVRSRDDGTKLTVSSETKNASDITMELPDGSTVTVVANKGVTFKLSLASTAVSEDIYLLTIAVVTVGGQTINETVEVIVL